MWPTNRTFFPLFSQANQFFAIAVGQRKGLFHEDVLSSLQGLFCNFIMEGSRNGYDDSLNIGIAHNSIEFIRDKQLRIGLAHFVPNRLSAVTDCFEGTKLIKITNKILPPVSGADDRDVSFVTCEYPLEKS